MSEPENLQERLHRQDLKIHVAEMSANYAFQLAAHADHDASEAFVSHRANTRLLNVVRDTQVSQGAEIHELRETQLAQGHKIHQLRQTQLEQGDEHGAQLVEMNGRLGALETDVATLKTDVTTLKSDVSTLKDGVAELLRRTA